MPSEKRQRQDEGRLLRLESQRAATQKTQRKRQARTLALIIGAIVVVAAGIAIFSADDADEASTSDTTDTSVDTTDPTAGDLTDPAIGATPCPPEEGTAEPVTSFPEGPEACIDATKTYTAEIATSRGDFTVELDAALAPKSVNNFVFLARNKYYDGVSFHRIIPGFVVQAGDPTGDPPGTGGPGYEYTDTVPTEGPPFYEVGSLAMANSTGPSTNGSQFFIVTGQQGVDLPANYTLFGKVTEGMDVVLDIEKTGTDSGTPSEETTITSVTITEK
jgi:cyclophilin family peptidyl-prolyl cis-trans isomerase